MLQTLLLIDFFTDKMHQRLSGVYMSYLSKKVSKHIIGSVLTASLLGFSSVSLAENMTVNSAIEHAEKQLDARIGVSVLDGKGKQLFGYNSDQRFPLMSTFKTLACAKLLHDNQINNGMMDKTYLINADTILDYAPIFKDKVGTEVSLKEACFATMTTSDNSAANLVLNHIDGPVGVTTFLIDSGDNVTRLDRVEPLLNEATPGDKRDTTTPYAMNKTISNLVLGSALNESSKQQLKDWMEANKVSNGLLRSVLPKGWEIADRSGAGGHGSRGITAVVWNEQKQPLVISIYLTGTKASIPERDEEIAQIGQAVFKQFGA